MKFCSYQLIVLSSAFLLPAAPAAAFSPSSPVAFSSRRTASAQTTRCQVTAAPKDKKSSDKASASSKKSEKKEDKKKDSKDDDEGKKKFDLNAYIKEKLPHVEKALDESVQSVEPETEKIVEAMKYSLMAGGKRIRPVLCLAACEMFAGEGNFENAMPAAVALEMIHTMSLIHDDLPSMDNDDLRRGKPTCHVVYGEDVAILAGDALLSTSFQHVAQQTPKDVDPKRVIDVVIRLGQSVGPKGLAGGQVMDLECEAKSDVTLDDLRWIHTHKTATLLEVAVASGAILGGAKPDEVKACEDFALNVGLAFQVADDILDVTQSTEELGKTAGKDEDTDKTTYPKLLGLDGAREEAERLIADAKKSLEPFGDRAAPLLALADFIIDRKN